MFWIILLSLLLFLFTLFLLFITCSKINIAFSYRFELAVVHKLDLFLSVMNIRIWQRTIDLPRLDLNDTTESAKVHSLEIVDWKRIFPFIKKIEVKKIDWETGIGTGEAHITGMVAGWLWVGQELVVKVLERYCKLNSEPIVSVQTNYQGEGLYSRLDCIFRLRLHTFLKIYRVINNQK